MFHHLKTGIHYTRHLSAGIPPEVFPVFDQGMFLRCENANHDVLFARKFVLLDEVSLG